MVPKLPLIMAAPNGARRTKADHPALPVTIAETVDAARACHAAGAGALHAHVRGPDGKHVLDSGLYRELMSEMRIAVPKMYCQITTEAVGRYSAEEQRTLIFATRPKFVSVALKEMVPDSETVAARSFYQWAFEEGVCIQHIVYSAIELERFLALVDHGVIPGAAHQLLFVLGRYSAGQESVPENLAPFLKRFEGTAGLDLDWAVCAFGRRETDCLVEAVKQGGKARIGFENGLWNRNGSLAKDNADRVKDLVAALNEFNPGTDPSELETGISCRKANTS